MELDLSEYTTLQLKVWQRVCALLIQHGDDEDVVEFAFISPVNMGVINSYQEITHAITKREQEEET